MTEYNGWTNYETWVVKLWMDNDQGTYDYFREIVTLLPDVRPGVAKLTALVDWLKEHHEEQVPDLEGFAADLLNAAMSEVNWHEIAASLIDDMVEA